MTDSEKLKSIMDYIRQLWEADEENDLLSPGEVTIIATIEDMIIDEH